MSRIIQSTVNPKYRHTEYLTNLQHKPHLIVYQPAHTQTLSKVPLQVINHLTDHWGVIEVIIWSYSWVQVSKGPPTDLLPLCYYLYLTCLHYQPSIGNLVTNALLSNC